MAAESTGRWLFCHVGVNCHIRLQSLDSVGRLMRRWSTTLTRIWSRAEKLVAFFSVWSCPRVNIKCLLVFYCTRMPVASLRPTPHSIRIPNVNAYVVQKWMQNDVHNLPRRFAAVVFKCLFKLWWVPRSLPPTSLHLPPSLPPSSLL